MYKIVIFGDGGVGKTSLIHRYLTGAFSDKIKVTIGVDFRIKKVSVNEKAIKLQIWDFAGEKRFRQLLPNYVRGSSAGLFMYDTTRYMSLENVEEWLDVIRQASTKGDIWFPILMIGGKSDLKDQKSVDLDEAKRFASEHSMVDVIECSAKTGDNVEFVFESVARLIMHNVGLIENP